MEENDAVEKFSEFFDAAMKAEITEVASSYPEVRSVNVDYRRLAQFDSDLADFLFDNPDEAIFAAEKALCGLGVATSDYSVFKPHARFYGLPESRGVMVINLGAEHLDKFITVEGIVSLATEIKPVIKTAVWECLHCGEKTRTHPEKNILKTPDFCFNKECGRRDFKHVEKEDTFVNMQNAQMQDLVEKLKGNAPTSHISLWLEDDIANRIQPGEKFFITGILRKRPIKKDGKLSSVYEKLLEVNHLERSEKEFEELEVTSDEEKELIAISQRPDLYDAIVKSIAPSIYGYYEMKMAIALQLFGGNMHKVLPDGKRIRGETHILLIGDPGTAKSATLQYVSRLAPKCIYVSGKGTSGVGLCVAPDSKVELPNGSAMPIGDLIESKLKKPQEDLDEPGAFFEEKTVRVRGVDAKLNAGILDTQRIWRIRAPEEMVRIVTSGGNQVTVTANTPILAMTTQGPAWAKSKNLTTRAFIAVASKGKTGKQTEIPVPQEVLAQMREKYPSLAATFKGIKATISRKHLKQITGKLPSNSIHAQALKAIASQGIEWKEITELEVVRSKGEWVYDFTLPSHAFFANGIAVHNTAAAEKDEFGEGWVLKAGAMVLASGGQVNIDELDKMDENDRSAMHEALESGTVSIAKAGIVTRFTARTSVLAAANPKLGRFNPNEPPAAQFEIGPTLLSRFDLLFPIKDVLDEVQDRKVAEHILRGHKVATGTKTTEGESILPLISIDLLRKYIAYARRLYSPSLSDEASTKIQEYYLRLRRMGEKQNYYPVTARQIEGLVRLAEASAKARFSHIVESQDAERAIMLTDYVLKTIFLDKETGRIDSDIINIGQAKSKTDKARTVLSIIEEKEKEVDMVSVEEVVRAAAEYGMDDKAVREIIEQLHKQTEIFRPKSGFVRTSKRRMA